MTARLITSRPKEVRPTRPQTGLAAASRFAMRHFSRIKAALKRSPVLCHGVDAAQTIATDVRRAAWRRRRVRDIAAYLEGTGLHKLHLGAGMISLEGWLNTDLDLRGGDDFIFLDAREPFPLADACLDYIFSEHMIEHLGYADGLHMLRECRRTLRPGGTLRVATPDLAVLMELYRDDRMLSEIQKRYVRYIVDYSIPGCPRYDPVFVINNAFRAWGHRFLYDELTLRQSLEAAGFVDVACRTPGESLDALLRGIESHGKSADHYDMGAFETMVLEARRPREAS